MVRANVTAKFPTTKVADTDLGIFTNNVGKTLDQDRSSSQTSWLVSPDATGLEANQWLATLGPNGYEIIFVTAVDAAARTITATRAKDGTVAVAHKQGQSLIATPTAQFFNQIGAEVKAIETFLGVDGDCVTWNRALHLQYEGATDCAILELGLLSTQATQKFISFTRSTDAGATWPEVGSVIYDPTNDELDFTNIQIAASTGSDFITENDRAYKIGDPVKGLFTYDSADGRVEYRTTVDLRLENAGTEMATFSAATGNLNVQGGFLIGGTTLFENDRDFAVTLLPNADNALDVGSAARRVRTFYAGPGSYRVYAAAGDANASSVLGSGQIQFGAGGATALDVTLSRSAADVLLLASGDSLVIGTDGSTGVLGFGVLNDAQLYRGGADRLDLATGDSFNIVNGNLQMAATTLFEADRDLAVTLTPNADASLSVGASSRRFLESIANNFLVYGAAADANPVTKTSSAGLDLGAGGASATDVNLARNASSRFVITGALAGSIRLGMTGAGNADLALRAADADANPYFRVDNTGLGFGAGGASATDVFMDRSAAKVLRVKSSTATDGSVLLTADAGVAGVFVLTDSSHANSVAALAETGLFFGAGGASAVDVQLSRGAADRLDLATGDSLNLVNGTFLIGGTTVFEADRDLAVTLLANADNTLDLGSTSRNWANVYIKRTAGSVLFMGASGLIQEDNASLFFDDTNNAFGIGTASPATTGKLTVQSSNTRTSGNAQAYFRDGVTVAKRLVVGFDGTNNIGWIQAEESGVAVRTLILNGDGGTVQIGAEANIIGALNHDGTTVGFYGVAPVAQAADFGVFTSNGVSANHTLVDVTSVGVADPVKVNANFDDVADGLNDIRTILQNLGLMA